MLDDRMPDAKTHSRLDEALEESFPASDPLPMTPGTDAVVGHSHSKLEIEHEGRLMNNTKNTLADNVRKSAIALLQARLSDAVDLTSQTKQAHWNVKGANFIALHGLFDRLHAEIDDHADTIAERLVALGGQAHGTVRSAGAASTLNEYPLEISASQDHVEALSSALARFGEATRNAIDDATAFGDQDTADVFTGVSRAVDKALWFVEAHAENSTRTSL